MDAHAAHSVYFKTFEDYINAIKLHGFDLIALEETRVTPELLHGDHSDYFMTLNDCPLHLVMKVQKPPNTAVSTSIAEYNVINSNATALGNLLPKKLTWNNTMMNTFANVAVVTLWWSTTTAMAMAEVHVDQEKSVTLVLQEYAIILTQSMWLKAIECASGTLGIGSIPDIARQDGGSQLSSG